MLLCTSSLLLASALISISSASVAAGGLCRADKAVVFSCTVRSTSKLVSVCSSLHLTKNSGYLQYRFGTPQNIELEFPSTTSNTQKSFSFESHQEPGEFEALNFRVGAYGYTVHRFIKRSELADGPDSAGVLVYQREGSVDKQVAELNCKSRRIENSMKPSNVISEPK